MFKQNSSNDINYIRYWTMAMMSIWNFIVLFNNRKALTLRGNVLKICFSSEDI